MFTSGRAADGQDFTNSARLLLAAVDKFTGRKLRSPTLERLDEYNRLQTGGLRRAGDPINDPLAMERGADARNTMQSLQKLSDFMAGVHGRRKAMVLISEGIDYDIYNLFDNNSLGLRHRRRHARRRLRPPRAPTSASMRSIRAASRRLARS